MNSRFSMTIHRLASDNFSRNVDQARLIGGSHLVASSALLGAHFSTADDMLERNLGTPDRFGGIILKFRLRVLV